MSESDVIRWVLDVETLWNTPHAASEQRQLTSQWASGPAAKRSLQLLSPQEQDKVLKFYFASDAKLSLGSCLLKRYAIVKTCGVSWTEAVVSQDSNHKPCYRPPDRSGPTVEFNVSHHGTLVALVACRGSAIRLGVDVVRMNWEKDYAMVIAEGFEVWARTYEMVFSDREVDDIVHFVSAKGLDPKDEIKAKLRHFYAHWCLKEAYVKMTGEALLAPWLKELEFRDVQVPMPAIQSDTSRPWGQKCSEVQIWFHGKQITDVFLEIQSFGDDYMVATAASSRLVSLQEFTVLDQGFDFHALAATHP